MKLDAETAAQFEYAVRNHYWYQLYLDDLPIWGMVGEVADTYVDDSGARLMVRRSCTRTRSSVSFNDARIIQVNLTSENPVTLSTGTQLDFTYSVEWKPTTTSLPSPLRPVPRLRLLRAPDPLVFGRGAARTCDGRASSRARAPANPPDDGPRRYSIPS